MIGDLLSGLIWQSRLGLKADGIRAYAAHGYVDNAYRPPQLPFVSIVGPLSFNVEPEREAGRQAAAPVRVPGHVIGRPRAAGAGVPNDGSLRLRFDARLMLTLTGLPGGSFDTAATGPLLAAAIANGIRDARNDGAVTDANGTPLDEEATQTLEDVTCRWDPETRRFAIASVPAAGERVSRVELLPVAGDIAAALGLSPPESARDGYSYLHRLPAPRAVTVDVQLNLWASSQRDLALLMEDLAILAPTRGNVLTRPSLLQADVAAGASTIRLLDEGEPTLADSLLHLEAAGGFTDRVRGASIVLSAGTSAATAPARLVFAPAATASMRLYPSPLVANPLHSANPAPNGLALALGLRLDAGAVDGSNLRLLELTEPGGARVFGLELVVVSGEGDALHADLDARATLRQAGVPIEVRTRLRLPLATLEAGFVGLHARLDASAGVISLWVDGQPQRLGEPTQTPLAPTRAPGSATVASADMSLVVGRAAPGNAVGFALSHLHVIGAPLGALDPALRRSLTGGARIRPGDPIVLARSEDGYRPSSTRFHAIVVAVEGARLELSSPLNADFRCGQTLAFCDECFYFQTSIKRRDDLLNHLYRACVDYRVSALIEDERARSTAALAERVEVNLVALGAGRNESRAPGVDAVITDNKRTRVLKERGV
jgi:hypothetical protein